MTAHQLRNEVRRTLNGAIAELCPGQSGDFARVLSILESAAELVETNLPAVIEEQRRESRLRLILAALATESKTRGAPCDRTRSNAPTTSSASPSWPRSTSVSA